MKNSRKNQLFRRLLAATLLLGGTFQLAAPVLAQTVPPTQPGQDTTAGKVIRNTATGTYEDPNQPGQTINTTSNTVTITVAEVAGITVTGSSVVDANGGTLQPNDNIQYNFTVTNVGNDATRFFIPNTAAVSGPGTLQAVQYSTDGTYTDVPADGLTTGSINPGGTFSVRVVVRANASATAATPIAVTLGNTDPANAQNVPVGTAAPNDVRTVDNTGTDGGDASAAAPANGEQEASATQSTSVGAALVILNGPNNQPAAVGTNNNDDFTNASTPVPAGVAPDQPINPGTRTITNTIKSTTTTDPGVISLLPTVPANPTALPDGTLVTIVYPGGTGGTAQTAVYQYTQATGFTFVNAGSTGTGADDPVEINLPIGGQDNYQVTVDLPNGTAQFTDFPVPITAFIDNDNNGSIAFTDANANGRFDPGEANYPSNTTIDRLYTGFLRLTKDSRILLGDGPAVQGQDGDWSTGSKTPAPGNIIEYRITYKNISAANQGSGNSILEASSIKITENGTTGTNTWALDSDTNGQIDTSNDGTPADTNQGSITTTTNTNGEITQYVDTVPGRIAPGRSGEFTFRRKVN
jgi:hypothetical protein